MHVKAKDNSFLTFLLFSPSFLVFTSNLIMIPSRFQMSSSHFRICIAVKDSEQGGVVGSRIGREYKMAGGGRQSQKSMTIALSVNVILLQIFSKYYIVKV